MSATMQPYDGPYQRFSVYHARTSERIASPTSKGSAALVQEQSPLSLYQHAASVMPGSSDYGPSVQGEDAAQILLEKTFLASGYLTGFGFGEFSSISWSDSPES